MDRLSYPFLLFDASTPRDDRKLLRLNVAQCCSSLHKPALGIIPGLNAINLV